MAKCKICETETDVVFNIELTPVPICEKCAPPIFIQQAKWYVENTPNAKSKDANKRAGRSNDDGNKKNKHYEICKQKTN